MSAERRVAPSPLGIRPIDPAAMSSADAAAAFEAAIAVFAADPDLVAQVDDFLKPFGIALSRAATTPRPRTAAEILADIPAALDPSSAPAIAVPDLAELKEVFAAIGKAPTDADRLGAMWRVFLWSSERVPLGTAEKKILQDTRDMLVGLARSASSGAAGARREVQSFARGMADSAHQDKWIDAATRDLVLAAVDREPDAFIAAILDGAA